MMRLLLASASRVCVSTTAWLPRLERSGLRTAHGAIDLPIASSIVPVDAPADIAALAAQLKGRHTTLIGHFGSFGRRPSRLLSAVARRLLARAAPAVLVLIGRDSDGAATALARELGQPPDTIVGSGTVDARQLSMFIQACDIFVQPYIDGATTRRSTLTTLLAHGVPVVTTAGPLTEPEWHASPRPVVAVPVDPDALAGSAVSLLESTELRRDLAMAARTTYAARFDIDRTAERLLAA